MTFDTDNPKTWPKNNSFVRWCADGKVSHGKFVANKSGINRYVKVWTPLHGYINIKCRTGDNWSYD